MSKRKVLSEHHFLLTVQTSQFELVADSLKPFLVTEGNWKVKFLYIMGSLPKTVSDLRIRSPNVVTDNGIPLIMTFFTGKEFRDNDHRMVLDAIKRVSPITLKSDRLTFWLETWDGMALPSDDPFSLTIALALIQEQM